MQAISHRHARHSTASPVAQARQRTQAFYDAISRVYDVLAEHSEEPIRHIGLNMFNAQPGEHVLEVGFGTGHSLVALAQAVGLVGRVYGIDLSEGMRLRAEALLQRSRLADRVELCRGDALHLPYGAERFDGVFMSFTLELFDAPQMAAVLAECRRVLRPDGRIAVVALSKEGDRRRARRLYEWAHEHFPTLVDCRPIYVRRSLAAAGFSIEEVETQMMWVPVEIVLARR